MQKAAAVGLLLLGVCLCAAAAQDAEAMSAGTKKYGGEKLSSYKKHQDEAPYGKEHAYKDCDCKDGIDGKDGKDGRPGERGPEGKPGRPGKPGKPGKDGKSALIEVEYYTSAVSKVDLTCNVATGQKHFLAQLPAAVAKCDDANEKAVACSCDTGMVPAFSALPSKAGEYDPKDHGEDWTGRVNSITLVKNALGKSSGSLVNNQCTCIAQYQATVSCPEKKVHYVEKDEEKDEIKYPSNDVEEGEEGEEGEEEEQEEQEKYEAAERRRSKKSKKYSKKHGHAAIASAAAGASGLDWTSSAPKQQSFSLTATVTCVEIKEVHGGENGDEEGEGKDEEKKDEKPEVKYPGEEESEGKEEEEDEEKEEYSADEDAYAQKTAAKPAAAAAPQQQPAKA